MAQIINMMQTIKKRIPYINLVNEKQYKSFHDQLLANTDIMVLGYLYGRYMPLRFIIEIELKNYFADFTFDYYNAALNTVKMIAVNYDVKYHNKITINIGD